jgi:hypothetical protein
MSSDESELEFVETTPGSAEADGDVIRGRRPRPPVRWSVRPAWLALLLAVVLAAGIGIGYLAGPGERRAAAPSPTPPPTPPTTVASSSVAGLILGSTGNTCSGVPADGRRLLLGIEIVNTASRPVLLRAIHADLPLSGLRVLSTQVGQCAEHATQPAAGHRLESAAAAWISLTAEVLVRCPAPLPVRFDVDYTFDGASASQLVGGFSDLGSIPFPGCPTS